MLFKICWVTDLSKMVDVKMSDAMELCQLPLLRATESSTETSCRWKNMTTVAMATSDNLGLMVNVKTQCRIEKSFS